jgi:L-alanine-DL-glutamate epimerase-like enolase superfamily enzyme
MKFDSDVRILEAEPIIRFEKARTPLKFGGVIMDAALYFVCRVRVENRQGDVADGYGGIFLSDVWGWPTPNVAHPVREEAMKRLAEACVKRVAEFKDFAHPIDIFLDLERELPAMAQRVCDELQTAEPMPFLCALISLSAVDAALHDAFGNVNRVDTYAAYGKEFGPDLRGWMQRTGIKQPERFAGKYVGDYLRPAYLPEVPLFHLVGGLDKLTRAEITDDDPQDDLPVSLDDWVKTDGLFCLKVKLRGTDLAWDLQRMKDVYRIGIENTQYAIRNTPHAIYLTADTNEMCDTPDYMIELLTKLREQSPQAFESLLYVEQPTHRDLAAHPFDMRALAQIKPVFVDESLTDMTSFDLAMELSATGVALKTCKGHSMCLLMVARCHEENVPYAVQDLTNPSLAMLHSVGLAARIHTVMGVESNSRQFFPRASDDVRAVHRDIVDRPNGVAKTHSLKGCGLGFQKSSTTTTRRHDGL